MNSSGLRPGMKIAYGAGDFGRASYNTLRMFFYAIFLTDVVGLNAILASMAALVAIIWDAVNDPLVGILTDRARTRWGRRRPFFLWFSIPFGLSFLLLWWAPPWNSQAALAVHVTLAFMLSDTFQTLVSVPYLALGPELAPGYDQRTSLMSWRMFFNLAASLVAAGAGPELIDMALRAGLTTQRAYFIMGAVFGGIATVPFLVLFFVAREEPLPREAGKGAGLIDTFRVLWSNKPFVITGAIYVLNWICFDLLALMIPYYLLYWLSGGDMLARVRLFGVALAPETAAFGILLGVAIITIPFWNFLAHRTSKRSAYIFGMSVWAVLQCVIWTIPEGKLLTSLWIAGAIGITTSSAHVLPESMFPEAIDWDELRSGKRREGIYYGAITFVRKLASALATFIALQVLGRSGYAAPPEGVLIFSQSTETLTAIRLLSGPGVLLIIVPTILLTFFMPMDRVKQERVRRLLEKRRTRKTGSELYSLQPTDY